MPAKTVKATKRPRPASILTQAHYDAIDAALRRLADLPEWIDAAELCDMDCQEYRQAHQYLIDKLTKIQARFFPQGRPTQ